MFWRDGCVPRPAHAGLVVRGLLASFSCRLRGGARLRTGGPFAPGFFPFLHFFLFFFFLFYFYFLHLFKKSHHDPGSLWNSFILETQDTFLPVHGIQVYVVQLKKYVSRFLEDNRPKLSL